MISSVIDNDIPTVEKIEYATLIKAKHLLTIIATQTPSPLNAKRTAEMLDVSTNQRIKILSLLERSRILRLLYYKSERNLNSMAKPQKMLFNNSSLLYALGYADAGKVRETFFAAMLTENHDIAYPKAGDLIVDNHYLFEIGGARKGFDQIKDIPDSFDSFVAAHFCSDDFFSYLCIVSFAGNLFLKANLQFTLHIFMEAFIRADS